MKVVIIAGGVGTRLLEIAQNLPKPMLPINGKPILDYQIELAKRYGLKDILILTGHLGERIENYFGDGRRWGVKIRYFHESKPLGTAGAVKRIERHLKKDFFVFYGDTIMDIALDKMLRFHRRHKGLGTLCLHPNDHPFDSDLLTVDDHKQITQFYPKPRDNQSCYRNLVNAGLYILSPKLLKHIPEAECSDFGKNIFPRALTGVGKLFGYISAEYIKDMGTPDRYEKVAADVLSGKVARLNLHRKRPAIFLDRDGVINRDINLISRPEDLDLLPGAAKAIRKINQSDCLAVVVTNQPVIAKNLCDLESLRLINNRLETLLGRDGAYLDAIYSCPHHPDKGFPEERPEYKIKCDCRKPAPGMLFRAAKDMNIDLADSYMLGDRESDISAGKNAGLKEAILVPRNAKDSLLHAVTKIIG
jgi:histidinol-phosphate phosphatase family protein